MIDLDSASDEELERQFSPSKWSPRMSADTIVDNHVRVAAELSARFQPAFSIPYGDSGEIARATVIQDTMKIGQKCSTVP